MNAQGVPGIQIGKERYQNVRLDEENAPTLPISYGYQPIPPILQSKSLGSPVEQGVRRNAPINYGPIGDQFPIGIPSTTPMDPLFKDSAQSILEINHHHQVENSELHQLAGHGAPGIIGSQNQCQSISAPQVSIPNPSQPILHGSIASNIKKGPSVSPIQRNLLMGDPSLVPMEITCSGIVW
ncbi:hypothetical protein A4A49_04097 [Nicotiana attenuata]|uniref:Uncharacterized protein n=1 Tax=Nicotiana attenuata TaxID=49451 RepID=A0A314LAD9_NICAT|nr:hypothetical protein A4A49_04097 [Nicotiana attenuata]